MIALPRCLHRTLAWNGALEGQELRRSVTRRAHFAPFPRLLDKRAERPKLIGYERLQQLLDLGTDGLGEVRPGERVSDIGREKADRRTAIEGAPLITERIEGLALEQRQHRIGKLDFAAGAFFLARENRKDLRLENVAAKNGEVGRLGSGLRLLHHAVDGEHATVAFAAEADDAVILHLIVRHGLDREDVAAMLRIGVDYLGEAAFALRLHQDVGEEQRERLVADDVARAPDGVAEPERLLLAGEARAPRWRKIIERIELGFLAALGEHLLELGGTVEMILDQALAATSDEDEMLDAGIPRLVHDMLNDRTVDDGQHLLGYRLGRWQEARAKPCHGKHGLADAMGHSGDPSLGLTRQCGGDLRIRSPSTSIR